VVQQSIKPSKVKARPRRTTAELQVPVPQNILVRRLVAAISAHDFNQNHAILRSRAIGASVDYAPAIKRKGPMARWYSIRAERREALRVVSQALVIHADYSYDSEYLFEVKCSRRMLARDTGLAIQYEPEECNPSVHPLGRIDTSRLDRSIRELFLAGLIHIVYERKSPAKRQLDDSSFDDDGCKYQKISRIFLKPEFFSVFGFSRDDVMKAMTAKRKYDEKKGRIKRNHAVTKRELWQLNFTERNLAQPKGLLRLRLEQIKQSFIDKSREERRQQREQEAKRRFEDLTPAEQLRHRYIHATIRISEAQGGTGLYLVHQSLQEEAPDIPEGSEEYMRRFIALYESTIKSNSIN